MDRLASVQAALATFAKSQYRFEADFFEQKVERVTRRPVLQVRIKSQRTNQHTERSSPVRYLCPNFHMPVLQA